MVEDFGTIVMDKTKNMEEKKSERLEAHSWKVGTAAEFLELTVEEAALVEIKLALSRGMRKRRGIRSSE